MRSIILRKSCNKVLHCTRAFDRFSSQPPTLLQLPLRHFVSDARTGGTTGTVGKDINADFSVAETTHLKEVLNNLQWEFRRRSDFVQPRGIPRDPLFENDGRVEALFDMFLRTRPCMPTNKTMLISGPKGTGRSTLLLALLSTLSRKKEQYRQCTDNDYEYFEHYIDVKPLYLSDAIHCDETDPRLSFGGDSFIKLQYRLLHAATGAPPALFSKVVLEIRRRLGLETWVAFPNDVLYGALRRGYRQERLLILVDDTHPPNQPRYPISLPPPKTNSLKDLHRLHYACCKHKENYYCTLIIGVTSSYFGDPKFYRIVFTMPPPNPKPHIVAAREVLRLAPNSQRMDEVRYMLRHAAVHARFLSDTYHLICAGGLTSVADFDAQFHAFVNPRIEKFLAHCRERHLDPRRLFDLLAAKEGSKIIEPITIAADALGLCTIAFAGDDCDGPCPSMHIHPKVFAILHDAIFQPAEGTNPSLPLSNLPLLVPLCCLVHRVNAYSALVFPQPMEHIRGDVVLIALAAQLAQLAVDARGSSQRPKLASLFASSESSRYSSPQKKPMNAILRHMGLSYLPHSRHTPPATDDDVPLYLDGIPRAVYSFQALGGGAVPDPSGLLTDPSTAPALLQSMAPHGVISGTLHGVDVVGELNDAVQVRGSLTFGLVLIDAGTEDSTEAKIKKHRQRRADWWTGVKSTNSCSQAADFFAANIFVHLFVVDTYSSCRSGSYYSTEPFIIGDAQCFEVVVEKAELDCLWPVAARITTSHQ